MLREAADANRESMATGVPLDEVTDMRAERRLERHAASTERLQIYNDAVQRVTARGGLEDHIAKWIAMGNLRLRRNATRAEAFARGEKEDRIARWLASQDRTITRRTLLKGAAGGAALTLAALSGIDPRPAAASPNPKIVIIGGGLAGLACADNTYNKQKWTNVALYEANANFGGRCETLRNFFPNGYVADNHGESISSEHSTILGYVSRFNLTLEDTFLAGSGGKVETYFVNGTNYTQAQVNADWHNTFFNIIHNAVLAAPWPQTYNNHNAQGVTWDNQDVNTWMDQNFPGGHASNFGAVCQQVIRDEYGGEPSDSSALNLTMILGYNDSLNGGKGYQNNVSPLWAGTDERWHVVGGNDQIVTGLVNAVPASILHLNVACAKVSNGPNGPFTITMQPQPSGSSYTISGINGLILCNPFASMRNKVDLTGAGLSSLKMTAVNNLGMGTSGKIFIGFNGHPWQPLGYSGVTWQDNGPPYLSSGWEVPNANYAGPTTIWTGFPGGSYTPQILTTYGITAHGQVTPSALVTDCLTKLQQVWPGITNLASYYNGHSWCHFGYNDPWVQGGYCYWRVGQYTTFSFYEGVQEGKIHFGGEHTSGDFQGFMEGAAATGIRCAGEITNTG